MYHNRVLPFVLLLIVVGAAAAQSLPSMSAAGVAAQILLPTSATVEQELFGHVTLVEAYALPTFEGCHALVALRDSPSKAVAVITTDHRLQTVLETALQSGKLIDFYGVRLSKPPTPRGGTWGTTEVYQITGVILYAQAP